MKKVIPWIVANARPGRPRRGARRVVGDAEVVVFKAPQLRAR